MSEIKIKIDKLVNEIKSHHAEVNREALRLRTPKILSNFNKKNARSWCVSIMGDSLVRLRLIIEQNFNFIETLGIVSVTRYIFELSIWIHLFEKDERYGLIYYQELIATQKNFYRDSLAQANQEIEILKRFEIEEKQAIDDSLKNINHMDLPTQFQILAKKMDKRAARQFSLYTEQAQINGYGFQACLVEIKVVPKIEQFLDELESEQKEFDVNIFPKVSDLMPNRKKWRWNWKKMSEKVGLLNEYNYIYTFTSKLLHATPASITTDQKNLEQEELIVFLKYINLKIMDIVSLAKNYP